VFDTATGLPAAQKNFSTGQIIPSITKSMEQSITVQTLRRLEILSWNIIAYRISLAMNPSDNMYGSLSNMSKH
jgi:hypothetical protein